MSKNSLLLAILTLAPVFQTAVAQEAADSAALEEVIVQATRRALPAEDHCCPINFHENTRAA